MTTEIEYYSAKLLRVTGGPQEAPFWCEFSEYCRHHEGVWNSRVLAFVPQEPEYNTATDNLRTNLYEIEPDAAQFSDGTPVASYEQFN